MNDSVRNTFLKVLVIGKKDFLMMKMNHEMVVERTGRYITGKGTPRVP